MFQKSIKYVVEGMRMEYGDFKRMPPHAEMKFDFDIDFGAQAPQTEQ